MATKSSDLRRMFGVSKALIPASRAFVKVMDHFQETIPGGGKAWILINDADGTRVSVNTYGADDHAGKSFRAQVHPLPSDEKELEALLKGYAVAKVTDCPVAELITAKKAAPKATVKAGK